MKKFKKTSDYGKKDSWQINFEQLRSVYNHQLKNGVPVDEEDIESLILTLEKLGYLEFEG
jgi:hypothetical protein